LKGLGAGRKILSWEYGETREGIEKWEMLGRAEGHCWMSTSTKWSVNITTWSYTAKNFLLQTED
jgi:hypothetical protein